MIEIDRTFLTWQDYSSLFKVLQNGGALVFNKFCLTFEKTTNGSGFIAKVQVIGEETDNRVYFNLNTKLPKKVPKKVQPTKKVKKIEIDNETKIQETDGFDF